MKQLFRIQVIGSLQGVGFRLFVYRLARRLGLTGFVQNVAGTMIIEVEGRASRLIKFLLRVQKQKPKSALIYGMEYSVHDARDYKDFRILHSENPGKRSMGVLPDIGICKDCLKELFSRRNRRYQYPFISCSHCGPRYSIMHTTPYARENTSMTAFEMCPDCAREFEDEGGRRSGAINCCPACGPHTELWNGRGEVLATHQEAITEAVNALRAGKIVALKDTGGFRLVAHGGNEAAIKELRRRLKGTQQPFTLLYPSLEKLTGHFSTSVLEERLLCSPASPVVLLQTKSNHSLAQLLSPGLRTMRTMLPSTPLHYLLLDELKSAIAIADADAATLVSVIDEFEALDRFRDIADVFLVHNLPVARPVADSVARIVGAQEQLLERGRGYSSIPIQLTNPGPQLLAIGNCANHAIAVRSGKEMILDQRIAPSETTGKNEFLEKRIDDLRQLYNIEPEHVIVDLDPAYLSKKYLPELTNSVVPVQHHYAHILSCMADNEVDGPALGIAWDGNGYGTAGDAGGSEFLLISSTGFETIAHLRQFYLPKTGTVQPKSAALGLLYQAFGERLFDQKGLASLRVLSQQNPVAAKENFRKKSNLSSSRSANRLLEGIASIIDLRQEENFRGQAAMELEALIQHGVRDAYPFDLSDGPPVVIDWATTIEAVVDDLNKKVNSGRISAKFHNTLAEIIVSIADRVNEEKVLLSGSCFQNKYLTERAVMRLVEEGFRPYWHQRIPTNDGGIPAGQLRNIFYADVLNVFVEDGRRMGKIRLEGSLKNVSLELLPNIEEGDKVLICDGASVSPPAKARSTAYSRPATEAAKKL